MKDLLLIAEIGFGTLTDTVKATILNGAGAAGDWRSKFIPNTIYGLDCTQVFNLHDYAYHVGITADDKQRADISMLINLVKIITRHGGFFESLRRYRAMTYYNAVEQHGDAAFFGESND